MCVSIHIIVWKGERYRERQRESGAQMSLEKTVGIIYTRERERGKRSRCIWSKTVVSVWGDPPLEQNY